jgi:hypothetical protein
MLELLSGHCYLQAVQVVTRLGIPDLLVEGPRELRDLARACGADEAALGRLLRAMAGLDLFEETEAGRFALTGLSRFLTAGAEESLRATALLGGDPGHWRAWGRLLETVRSGCRSAFELANGVTFFRYLEENEEAGALFQEVMSCFRVAVDVVLEVYDFGGAEVIVDVGGGDGSLLRAVLSATPGARGILFERPGVIRRLTERAGDGAADGRLSFAAGDFFTSPIPSGDLLLLRHVLHDWPDDEAAAILARCREAVDPAGRLVVIEHLLPEPPARSPARLLDVTMMVLTGGRERTEAEYTRLLEAAGFRVAKVVPTRAGVRVVEARPG